LVVTIALVPKKGNRWRACGDYRALNAQMVPDRYPVRHIEDFSQILQGKTIFSILDFVKAYHQIRVAEKDPENSHSTIPFGMYEFLNMSFGLKNAQTFQRFMGVLEGLEFCYAYIDDILVTGGALSTFKNIIRRVWRGN